MWESIEGVSSAKVERKKRMDRQEEGNKRNLPLSRVPHRSLHPLIRPRLPDLLKHPLDLSVIVLLHRKDLRTALPLTRLLDLVSKLVDLFARAGDERDVVAF
jgi:hypothetical protein